MSLDKILEHMLDAIEADNLWDTEAYAQMALDKLDDVDPEKREELQRQLETTVAAAQAEVKRRAEAEQKKQDLINEIVNFRG